MMGENIQSAYMLVYERKLKNPFKILLPLQIEPQSSDDKIEEIQEKEITQNNNIVSFKAEERNTILKSLNICKYYNTSEYDQCKERLFNFKYQDVEKNELIEYTPFYNLERKIPKDYYLEIVDDNSYFQKQQNIKDDKYIQFFENVITTLDHTISNITELSQDRSRNISKTLINFIFNFLTSRDKMKLLLPAIEKLGKVIENFPDVILATIKMILSNRDKVIDSILNDESEIVKAYSHLLYTLIELSFKGNRIKFLELVHENPIKFGKDPQNLSEACIILCELALSFYPKVPRVYICSIYPMYMIFKKMAELGNEMIIFFYSRDTICLFVTYFIGRDSPYHNDYAGKDQYWDLGRGSFIRYECLIDFIFYLYKHSTEFNSNQNVDSEKKLSNIEILELSEKDSKAIKSPSFLKYVYKNMDELFTEFLINLSKNNEDFTIQSCVEITRYIDDISYMDNTEFIKLTKSIMPILKIKDEYQILRLETILGYPQIIIDEPNMRHNFPVFGYNKIPDENTKWIDYKCTLNLNSCCPLLKKLLTFKANERLSCEIFLILLEAAEDNKELLKYLRFMSSEETEHDE